MDDRTLLELAARAAGLHGEFGSLFGEEGIIVTEPGSRIWTGKVWNPLKRDGDAFRLAVKLELDVTSNLAEGFVTAETPRAAAVEAVEAVAGDPYAATRRAITRAAAEIGRAMKEADHA